MENEENKIQDAEVSEPIKKSEEFSENASGEKAKKKINRDFYIELFLFLVLGVLVGIAVKNEAVRRVTVGFDDYKMRISKQDYNINRIQQDLIARQAEEQEILENDATKANQDDEQNKQEEQNNN